MKIYNKKVSHALPQNTANNYNRIASHIGNTQNAINIQNQNSARKTQTALALGQAGMQYLKNKRDEEDSLALTDALNQLEQEQIAFEQEYKNTNLGKNALNAGTDYQDFMKKRSSEIATQLKLSERASAALNKKIESNSISAFNRGLQYQTQQEGIYKEEVAQNAIKTHTAIINSNPNDYTRIAESTQTMQAEIQALYPNRDNTKIFEEQKQKDAQLIIDYAFANGDEKQARQLFEQTKELFGDSAPAILQKVTALEAKKAEEYKAKQIQNASNAATQVFYNSGRNQQALIDSIANDTNLTPQEQREVASKTLQDINTQERIEKLNAEKSNTAMKEKIALDMKQFTTPEQARAYVNSLPLEQQGEASKHLDLMLNGGDTATNQEDLSQIRTLIKQGNINTENFGKYQNIYSASISKKDWIKLEAEMKASEESHLSDYTNTMFKRDMQKNFGTSSTDAQQLYKILEAETYELGIRDPIKKRDYILNQAQSVTVDEGMFSFEKSVPLRQAKDLAKLGVEIIIPEDFRKQITEQESAKGNSVTEDFVISSYFNYLQSSQSYNQ